VGPASVGRAWRRLRLVAVLALVAALVGLGSGSAWAWWSASAAVTATASVAPVIPAPPTPACSTTGIVNVRFTFTDPTPAPPVGVRSYTLVVRSGTTVVATIDNYTSGTAVTPAQLGNRTTAMTATLLTKVAFSGVTWQSSETAAVGITGGWVILYYLGCS
jgi:hypothetical protein